MLLATMAYYFSASTGLGQGTKDEKINNKKLETLLTLPHLGFIQPSTESKSKQVEKNSISFVLVLTT